MGVCGAHAGITPAANGCVPCSIIQHWDERFCELANELEALEPLVDAAKAHVKAIIAIRLETLRRSANAAFEGTIGGSLVDDYNTTREALVRAVGDGAPPPEPGEAPG